ncbi:recombinase RecT [Kitasatospora sp. RB6PN24]|uniref:recombinase RecT n=1 Tax=Kitasatospora humi TaxID=2893891 RepID=UPI001E529BE7|nr:recombinase RecT [Kitasatospora humi]MCC9309131.1 recombinase RecT [Kitasatospora humi]
MTTTQQDRLADTEPLTPLTDNRAQVMIENPDQVLEITGAQRFWTKAQRSALASIGLANAPTHELVAYFHICKSTGLDPFRREIYYIQRKRRIGKREELYYTAQTGIDGFRHIGQRSGRFIRRVGPFWTGPEDDPAWWTIGEDGINRRRWVDVWLGKGLPAAAMCRIEHYSIAGDRTVSQAVALFSEFAVTKDEWANNPHTGEGERTGNKVLSGLWPTMGVHMIGKVAEAQAWRIGFPRELTGIYEHDEMGRADQEQRELAREDAAARRRTARENATVPEPVIIQGGLVDTTTGENQPGEQDGGDQLSGDEPPGADELRAELRAYANAMGSTVTTLTQRWRKSSGKKIGEATVEDLQQLLDGLRDHAVTALRQRHPDAAEHLTAGGLLVRLNPAVNAWLTTVSRH